MVDLGDWEWKSSHVADKLWWGCRDLHQLSDIRWLHRLNFSEFRTIYPLLLARCLGSGESCRGTVSVWLWFAVEGASRLGGVVLEAAHGG